MGAAQFDQEPSDMRDVTDGGERVTHLSRDHVYYGHLSLYAFAARFSQGAHVLDAGSGAGYGTAYLADAGAASVIGIDVSEKAVAFSRRHFQRPNLSFQVMDLGRPLGFPDGQFDLIYTSNTLEHIANVDVFLREAWRLLTPAGRLIIAVPPIITDEQLSLNLVNPYHVNLWSPRQWQHALSQYFGHIAPYSHGIHRIGTDFEAMTSAELLGLTEASFVFEASTAEGFYQQPTLTAIFVVSQPRASSEVPLPTASLTYVDASFTRPAGHIDPALRRRLKRHFDRLQPPTPKPAKELSLIQKTMIIGRQEGLLPLALAIITYPLRLWRSFRRK